MELKVNQNLERPCFEVFFIADLNFHRKKDELRINNAFK